MAEFRAGLAELAGQWQRVAGVSFLVGNLAVATFGGAFNSCGNEGGGSKPRTPASSPTGGAPEDDNTITCGELTHLDIYEGAGRVLIIDGTEITVGLAVSKGQLKIDQGNDGSIEGRITPGDPDVKLQFSPGDTMDITFSYNNDPVRPFGSAGIHRTCPVPK